MTPAGFLRTFMGVAAALAAAILVALVLLDPYASGRLTPFDHRTMFETGPRTANAWRLRNPRFDAAVIGNSTMQMMEPARLDALTGLSFVQLTIPGTGPREQAIVARRLAETRGADLKAVVLGADYSWCDPTRLTRMVHPFPDWLYADGPLGYLAGVFRLSTLEVVPRRLGLMLGRERRAREDGFWDYERLVRGAGIPDPAEIGAERLTPRSAPPHSAAAGLTTILAALPATTRLVVVLPPVFVPEGHDPADATAQALAACKAEIAGALRRPNAVLVDFMIDSPLTRDRTNFIDHNHYRAALAREVETAIAAALGRPR